MKAFAALLLAMVLCTGYGLAQTTNASLGGTVTDASGAVVAGAAVTVTGIDTGVVTKTSSNASGAYQFPSLQAGNYRVSAEMKGFQKITYDPVVLRVSGNVRLNFTLPVAGAVTTVEVTAAAESPLLTSSAVVGSTITGQQILDLPLIDRGANNLALSSPGISGGIGEGVNVAGGATMSLVTTVNGINVSNTRLTRAGGLNSFQLTQSVDMVEEVRTVTSPADVEGGRALGQVQMIVRSGTNEFHGSVVDGLRNTAFNANTFFNNQTGLPRQDLKRNQFAGRIGGPIIKNRTFFFFLYDGQRQNTSASANYTVLAPTARAGNYRFFPGVQNANANAAVPTVDLKGNPVKPATATGDLQTVSVFGRDPNRPSADSSGLVAKFLGQTPLPNNYLVGDGLNTAGYLWQVPSFNNRNQYTFKVDHEFNSKHRGNIVVTHEVHNYTSTAEIYPNLGATGVSDVDSWFVSLNLTSAFKPTMLNEFRYGFQHPDMNQVSGTRAYPQVYPSNNGVLFTPGFSSFNSPIPGNIDSELVDPVYTLGDSLSWIRGRHSFKWGFQFDWMASNSWNINNGYVPSVTFGAGSVAVTGITTIPGIGQNSGTATNILTDLSGSVSQMSEGFGVANGAKPEYIVYRGQRSWHQRDMNGFFKDDFKVTPNLTVNYGIRWDWVGIPWDRWGRTPAPVNGFSGLFGISGTDMSALWQPGLAKGSLMQIQTVGPHSAHPDKKLYNNYYKGFAPALGFSWAIPYFGKNKTVLRMGYGWTRPMAQAMLSIDGATTTFGTTTTTIPTTITFVNGVSLPLKPAQSDPLAIVPLTDRNQSFDLYEPSFKPPVVQNFNVSLERQLTSTMTIAVRYVGNVSTKLPGGMGLNVANIFENGIVDAFKITQAGGNAPLFDQIFNGLNLGLGVVNGTTVTGSASLRQYSTTRTYFANDNPGSFASWLNTTNALTGVRGGLLSNGGKPQNFIVVNPQYSGVAYTCACQRASYNSMVIEFQKRFANSWAFQTNFVWSKTLQGGGTSPRNPRNWALDKSFASFDRKWAWKASGTYQFPFGPGKQFLSSKAGFTGFLGKLVEQWQLGGLLTLTAGTPLAITASGSPFTSSGTSTAVLVGNMPSTMGKLTYVNNGVVYFPGLTQVTDPSVSNLTTLQNLKSSSTLKALALSDGTVLFQNPTPGVIGNLALRTPWRGPGMFSLDMNVLKRFKVTERFTVEFRLDAIGVTNTPHFANPTTDINSTNFGRISAQSSTGGNQFTQPTPFNGNRVLVANLRISF